MRYYDSHTGRFVSEDPVRGDGGINPYEYAKDNPFRFVDPFGLWAIGVGIGAAGAAVVPGMGVMGEAGCMTVFDGHGNSGVLCCAGGGMAAGEALGGGGQGMGAVCLNCDTICDMPRTFGAVGGFATLGAGFTISGGASFSWKSLTVVVGIGPAGGEGAAGGGMAGGCKLVVGGSRCSCPAGK